MGVPYKQLPRDSGLEPMHDFATPYKSLQTLARETAATSGASSVITLTDNTTTIEVAAGGGPAYIRWVPVTETAAVAPFASVIVAAGTANFDNTIAANSVRRFAVPTERFIAQTSVVGLNKQYGLYNRVAIIGVASVASTEY